MAVAGGGRRTEDEREPARRLVVEHLLECDDVRVRRQPAQRLPGKRGGVMKSLMTMIPSVGSSISSFNKGVRLISSFNKVFI